VLILVVNIAYYFVFVRDYSPDYQKCLTILNENDEESYLEGMDCFDLAVRTNNRDIELCNKVTGEENRTQCFLIVSDKVGDPSFCIDYDSGHPTIKDMLDNCIIHSAVIKKDNSYCNYLNWGENYATCMAGAVRDPNYCKNGIDKDYCYLYTAIVMFDDDICKNIEDGNLNQICFAIILNQADRCNWLNEDEKELCKAVLTKNPYECLDIEMSDTCIEFIEIQHISSRLN